MKNVSFSQFSPVLASVQTLYLRSGGAMTLILTVEGASALNSRVIRSPMPGIMVEPPDKTTLAGHCMQIAVISTRTWAY